MRVIACQIETGERHWYILICYMVPGNGVKIWDVGEEMEGRPMGAELIVAGDLNVDMERMGRGGRV